LIREGAILEEAVDGVAEGIGDDTDQVCYLILVQICCVMLNITTEYTRNSGGKFAAAVSATTNAASGTT
jgi:hypothetical protein